MKATHHLLAMTLLTIVGMPSAMAAEPGMTYASLQDLPDFAGSWTPLTPPFVLAAVSTRPTAPPPSTPAGLADVTCTGPSTLRPEAITSCRSFITAARAARPGDRDYCARRTFTGQPSRGAGGSIEVLLTPGQVTLSVESGLTRRIYLRDRPPPGALDESFSGTSIGRWDGKTLVVETSGLDPKAMFLPGTGIGSQASVRERITLKDADTLEIESTLTAPAILTAPLVSRQDYRRARDRIFTPFDTCVQGDRSFDQKSGRDQFDATPPADLPPPPGN